MAGLQLRPTQPLQHPEIAGPVQEAAREAGDSFVVAPAGVLDGDSAWAHSHRWAC